MKEVWDLACLGFGSGPSIDYVAWCVRYQSLHGLQGILLLNCFVWRQNTKHTSVSSWQIVCNSRITWFEKLKLGVGRKERNFIKEEKDPILH